MDENRILGEEKISKLLLKFAVPCVAGLLISAFYNIVDQIFIGNSSLGYLGNAATGISFPIICIANAFAWCIGDGAASFLSICAGRQDSENAHKCVGTGISATLLISVVLTVISLLFARPLMSMFGASEQTLQLSVDYFRIIALFFLPYLMFNVMNSMIRADGSPTYAMIAIIIGAVLNIILDPLFIFVFDWGIKGAAWATAIGQMVSFILCLVYFFKPKSFHLTKSSFRIDGKMVKQLAQMGGSTFITQISIVIMTLMSNVVLFHYGALSVYGSDIPISVFSIQTKVYTIVINIVVGIALGGQPILGYNYGARKYDRVRKTYMQILYSVLTVGIVATAIFQFCPEVIIGIFGTGSELYLDFAVKTFRIYLSFSIVTCLIKLTSVFFQAIGKSMEAMITSLIRDILCFVSFTLFLCWFLESRQPGQGIYGILYAAPMADIVAGFIVVILTVRFFRNLKEEPETVESEPVIRASHEGLIITIARQHGSMGKQIGQLVAEKMNIPCYTKELTALAASQCGLASEFIEDVDENHSSLIHQLYCSKTVEAQAIVAQEKIINMIADQGACVIVGRAADYVLKDRPNVLSLFLYAPEEVRIRNIMEMYGDDRNEAREQMIRSDRARAAYKERISGKAWEDMDQYDLCISTEAGKERIADMILNWIESTPYNPVL